MTHTHHAFDYIELTVTDLPAAQGFYEQAFGWEFTPYGPDYAGIKGPGREIGGLTSGSAPAHGGPLVLLYSDDLDATVDSVVAAGGTVVDPPYEFPGGRRFTFTDPSGNVLGAWTEAAAPE